MSNHLYLNYKNRPVTSHSYSGGVTFRFCKRRYKLERKDGWRQKENNAATHFGDCVETAAIYHVNNKNSGGIEHFVFQWNKFKDDKTLHYTDKEKSWEDMLRMGQHMLRLFEIWWPTSGITNPKFQLQYKKEVFPGNQTYSGLEFTSYVDIRADYKGKPLVVDVKTASLALPENPVMLRLDAQLPDYAWVTGIPDIAFLNFVKGGASFEKGDRVTQLVDGKEFIVAFADEKTNSALVLTAKLYEKYAAEVEGIKGNALKEIKERYTNPCLGGPMTPIDDLTKCRLQFLTTTVSAAMIAEAGQIEGQNMVDIKTAEDTNNWPQDGKGIRFPNNKCTFCPMAGICTGDDKLRDETLINLNAPKTPDLPPPVAPVVSAQVSEEDWLDKLLSEL
jgi:hypothetical protein